MARKRTFTKNNKLVSFICGALAIALLIVGIGALSSFTGRESKTISATAFSVGGLDENGRYEADEQSIYTKEAFNCIGLRIEPAFDMEGTFDVYYYDYNDNLLDARHGLTRIYDEDYPLAKTARVVFTPDIPEGESRLDWKISSLEVIGFARNLKITVSKDQTYLYENSSNLFNVDKLTEGKTFVNSDAPISTWTTLEESLLENAAANVTGKIAVSGEYEYYDIFVKVKKDELPATSAIVAVVADAEGNVCADEHGNYASVTLNVTNSSEYVWHKLTVELPYDVEFDHLRVSLPANMESCYIFGYND